MKNFKKSFGGWIVLLAIACVYPLKIASAQEGLKINPFPVGKPVADTAPINISDYKNLRGRDLYEEIRRQTGQKIENNSSWQTAPQTVPQATSRVADMPVPWYRPIPEQDQLLDEKTNDQNLNKPKTAIAPPVAIAPVSKPSLQSRQWPARAGQDLKELLGQWSVSAGVDLLWQSKSSFSVPGDMNLMGSFEDAVGDLLAQYSDSSLRPIGTLYVSRESGKRVLLIQSQRPD